jgi:lysocardiolipin and lysophospholipid acyltransferase
MIGLLIIVYTVVFWYFMSIMFIFPSFLLGNIQCFKKIGKELQYYFFGITMQSTSFFYHNILKIPMYVYGDTISKKGTNLFIMNHRSSLDFLFFISLLTQCTDPEKTKIVLKSILKYVPGIGWITYANDFPLLNRSFTKDINYLKNIGTHEDEQNLLIFPEGTRYTIEKRESSNMFSKQQGYPIFNNVLLPKSKGTYEIFKSLINNNSLNKIYDLTIKFEGIERRKAYTVFDLIFKNNVKAIHIHINEISPYSIPTEENNFRKWLHKIFVNKDILLDLDLKNWDLMYKKKKFTKKSNFIWFNLLLIIVVCFIYLFIKSSYYRWINLILLIIGTIIVFKNDKYKIKKKYKINIKKE